MQMKRFLLFVILFLSGCAPSPLAIQNAIAETQVGWTKTPSPTPTSTHTPTLSIIDLSSWAHCVLGRTISREYFDSNLRKRTCVYGVIRWKLQQKEGFEQNGNILGGLLFVYYDIGIEIDTSERLVVIRMFPKEALNETYPFARGILTTADTGDCIVVLGFPEHDKGSVRIFVGVEVQDLSQLALEFGASDSKVQEMAALCK